MEFKQDFLAAKNNPNIINRRKMDNKRGFQPLPHKPTQYPSNGLIYLFSICSSNLALFCYIFFSSFNCIHPFIFNKTLNFSFHHCIIAIVLKDARDPQRIFYVPLITPNRLSKRFDSQVHSSFNHFLIFSLGTL